MSAPLGLEIVLAALCWYDPRNPNFVDYGDDLDDRREPRKACACDCCFYGRDRLALDILRLKKLE